MELLATIVPGQAKGDGTLGYRNKGRGGGTSRDQGGVDMCAMNKAGLMPIHLAIARSHFFVVHWLLSKEVVLRELKSNHFKLYTCLKLAITNRSVTTLKMLYSVFRDIIDAVHSNSERPSFWERSFQDKDKEDNKDELEDDDYIDEMDRERDSDSDYSCEDDFDESNSNGQYSLLHYASACGDFEIFCMVMRECTQLEHTLFSDKHNQNKEVPLHWAVQRGNIEIVE